MFGRKPPTRSLFDDVASDKIKDVRAAINAASNEALVRAAGEASLGNAEKADALLTNARILRSQAINIPLEMLDRKIDLDDYGTILNFDS